MTIIPAIDIIDGKCVRLTKGDYNAVTTYSENPLDIAKQFEDAGLNRLHLVDLDGARAGKVQNWKTLEKISANTKLKIDFSGGLSTRLQVKCAFEAGATWCCIGSMAVENELVMDSWIMYYGPEKFIISADSKNEKILIKGWTYPTDLTVFELIESYRLKGITQFMCTDVNVDGMLSGPSIELYKKILQQQQNIHLIASGGVSSLEDLHELEQTGCSAAIIGKAIYENKIQLNELTPQPPKGGYQFFKL